MASPKKVTLSLAHWSAEYGSLLARAAGGPWAAQALVGIEGAVKRGDALLCLATLPDGAPVGVAVISYQTWPLPLLYVHAVAAVPKSGFSFGPAFLPSLLEMARLKGALGVRAEVMDVPNERRLRRIGFKPEFTVMVAPV